MMAEKRRKDEDSSVPDVEQAPEAGTGSVVSEADASAGEVRAEDDSGGAASASAAPVAEVAEEALERLREEVASVRDRHLRLAAEYENYRKRTARERTEVWSRAQADVIAGILDVIDDLARVTDLDPAGASAKDVIQGVELVERKMLRQLENAGLERVGAVGDPFDPNHHEAVGSIPAESEEADHTVGMILQLGYRFGGSLIRPARVQVCMWQGDAGGGGA